MGEIPVLGQMMGFCKHDVGKFLILSIYATGCEGQII